MRRFLQRIFGISVFTALTFTLSAQTYTIGTDNGSNSQYQYPTPFGNYYKTQRTQHLYRGSELTGAGMAAGYITEISWFVESLPGGADVTEGYTIKLLNTGVSSLSTTAWESGATTVWGPTDYTPVLGDNVFSLPTPFYWDGGNLIIEICGGDPDFPYTKNARVTWSGPLAFNGSHTRQSDTELSPCTYTGIEYYTGTPGGPTYRPVVTLTRIDGTNCTGMPDVSAAVSTDTSVCSGDPFTLTIDPILEAGITYSWQKSTDGLVWTDIPGATGATWSTSQTVETHYRNFVMCTYSGMVDISSPVVVHMNDATECYCIPPYTYGTIYGDYISHVVLEDIDNSTLGAVAPFYTFYDDISTELYLDSSYTISITAGAYATNNGLAAWIDYNQDGDFTDAGEKLGEATGLIAFATTNINFTVPGGALLDNTILRVRDVWNTAALDPCATYGYGETEDYVIIITPGYPPEASFTFSGDPSVSFTDLTTHSPSSWFWDFDDGGTSTVQNPVHFYTSNGTYTVCLTATNDLGSDTFCNDVVIDSYLPPTSLFTFSGDPTVTFTDLSSEDPTSWFWDFGDLTTSTIQNPSHTYATNGTFYVCLTATNAVGSNTSCQYILIDSYVYAPDASFTYFGDPTVFFVDFSTEDPTSWFWDFGDGGTSILENPSHTYAANGTYVACLTATNLVGSDMECATVVINGYPSPAALFTYTGDPDVIFSDLSTNDPTSWFWDFDDGSFSTEQNPVHAFALNGIYVVCLSISGAGGSDVYCDNIEIEMAELAPVTDFYYSLMGGYTVSFTDASANEPNAWTWDFGDGSISLLQNPSHTYATGGNYDVCLTTSNGIGNDLECKTVDVPLSAGTIALNDEQIFPNPANDVLNIEFESTMGECTIQLFDILGNAVPAQVLSWNQIGNMIAINTHHLSAGAYLILITIDEKMYSGKFIKE